MHVCYLQSVTSISMYLHICLTKTVCKNPFKCQLRLEKCGLEEFDFDHFVVIDFVEIEEIQIFTYVRTYYVHMHTCMYMHIYVCTFVS